MGWVVGPDGPARIDGIPESGPGAAQPAGKPGAHLTQTVSPRPVPVSLTLVIWRLPTESGPILKVMVP